MTYTFASTPEPALFMHLVDTPDVVGSDLKLHIRVSDPVSAHVQRHTGAVEKKLPVKVMSHVPAADLLTDEIKAPFCVDTAQDPPLVIFEEYTDPLPPLGAADVHVVPLEVRTFPDVPGATKLTALVPFPRITLFDVKLAAPVPPLVTARLDSEDKVPDPSFITTWLAVPFAILVLAIAAAVLMSAFSILVTVFVSASIDLFVNVSVVARPTTVSVVVGSVKTPEPFNMVCALSCLFVSAKLVVDKTINTKNMHNLLNVISGYLHPICAVP